MRPLVATKSETAEGVAREAKQSAKEQTPGTADDADCADKGSTSQGVDNIRGIRVIRGQEEAACFFLKRPAPGGSGAHNEIATRQRRSR